MVGIVCPASFGFKRMVPNGVWATGKATHARQCMHSCRVSFKAPAEPGCEMEPTGPDLLQRQIYQSWNECMRPSGGTRDGSVSCCCAHLPEQAEEEVRRSRALMNLIHDDDAVCG